VGDAERVGAAGLGRGLEQHHVVAEHGQAMGAGQPGRAGADHGDAPAAGLGALERVLAEVAVVEGEALQPVQETVPEPADDEAPMSGDVDADSVFAKLGGGNVSKDN